MGGFLLSGERGMIIKLFCKLCQRHVDWKHVHTCKEHLWFNAHTKNKEKHFSEKEFQQKKTEESIINNDFCELGDLLIIQHKS